MSEPKEPENSMEDDQRGSAVGEMHPRREEMADGRRYIIYYTFGDKGGEPMNKREGTPENV
jgi:hypothetical protein